ncbi:hypothetical protein MPER_03966, partial [Moniliophthora perniciosa FA553]
MNQSSHEARHLYATALLRGEMKAKCCTALGRYRQARECLEEALPTVAYAPSGTMALKGNLHEQAAQSFRNALALDHLIWEAFEGLCALVKRTASGSHPPKNDGPVATGAGFFTPDVGSSTGHIF